MVLLHHRVGIRLHRDPTTARALDSRRGQVFPFGAPEIRILALGVIQVDDFFKPEFLSVVEIRRSGQCEDRRIAARSTSDRHRSGLGLAIHDQ